MAGEGRFVRPAAEELLARYGVKCRCDTELLGDQLVVAPDGVRASAARRRCRPARSGRNPPQERTSARQPPPRTRPSPCRGRTTRRRRASRDSVGAAAAGRTSVLAGAPRAAVRIRRAGGGCQVDRQDGWAYAVRPLAKAILLTCNHAEWHRFKPHPAEAENRYPTRISLQAQGIAFLFGFFLTTYSGAANGLGGSRRSRGVRPAVTPATFSLTGGMKRSTRQFTHRGAKPRPGKIDI